MVAINFSVFTDKVADGSKCQTIRPSDRKGQIKPGVRLQLYTGMRTKACRKLVAVDPVCVSVEPVAIGVSGVMCLNDNEKWVYNPPLHICNRAVDLNYFAAKDGFDCWADLVAFFNEKYGLPFAGVLIEWAHDHE